MSQVAFSREDNLHANRCKKWEALVTAVALKHKPANIAGGIGTSYVRFGESTFMLGSGKEPANTQTQDILSTACRTILAPEVSDGGSPGTNVINKS